MYRRRSRRSTPCLYRFVHFLRGQKTFARSGATYKQLVLRQWRSAVAKKPSYPSSSWLNDVFSSLPRRDIERDSKSTTRVPVQFPAGVIYGEGGHEATALHLLNHFLRNGLARRVKTQPFCLDEIGGPRGRVPDVLVELDMDPPLHIIQCKSKRFITPEVQQKFDEEKAFLEPRGFMFHCWTDRDKLSRPTSQSIRLLNRGLLLPITHSRLSEIESVASRASQLGELLDQFGWDEAIAAAANGAVYFNITEQINEETPLISRFPRQNYELLFKQRSVPSGFWNALAP